MTGEEPSPEIREALRYIARLDVQLRTVLPVLGRAGRELNDELVRGFRQLNATYRSVLAEVERGERADG